MLTVRHNGTLTQRSQVDDYKHRGHDLEDMSVLSFFKDTYETRATNQDITPSVAPAEGSSSRRGRPRHTRSHYLPEHENYEDKVRVLRPAQHNTIANFVGRYLPSAKDVSHLHRHHASMLLLLKPWRRAQASTKRAIERIEQLYDCKMAADEQQDRAYFEDIGLNDPHYHAVPIGATDDHEGPAMTEGNDSQEDVPITEMILKAINSHSEQRDAAYAENAVEAGRLTGMLPIAKQQSNYPITLIMLLAIVFTGFQDGRRRCLHRFSSGGQTRSCP
ncbi:hypothetical protein BC834DRAFT_471976 [Gloeopeniophorella convolvens]|nr:hypothetical protein BC834DRAFT_471976 [Gloeopeniophorella convolvens]